MRVLIFHEMDAEILEGKLNNALKELEDAKNKIKEIRFDTAVDNGIGWGTAMIIYEL